MQFKDRHEAGRLLAEKLAKYKNKKNVVILAIPRGGVEIGFEVANALRLKLDIIVTKKIGLPNNEEFAIGSIGPNKKITLDEETVKIYNVSKDYIKDISKEIEKEIERRYKAYKGSYKLSRLNDRTVIIVDDGIATGLTAKSAVEYAKSQKAKKIIVAVPVAPIEFVNNFKNNVDEFICLYPAESFFSVSQFYGVFEQLGDADVKRYLKAR